MRLPQARLDQVLDRFREIEARMGAATDGAEIVRLSKEHAELKPVADAVVLVRPQGYAARGPIRFPWAYRMAQKDTQFEPFVLEHVAADGTKRSLDDLTDAMMIEIARMLPEPYRGIYADRCDQPHPAVSRDSIQFTGPIDDTD